MFLRKLITATAVAIVLVGCGKHSVTVSEVEFNDEKVYVDGHPFTGTVWSDDNATWQLTTTEGIPTAVTFYHNGGAVAYSMESSADTTDLRTYDEEGTLIPIDSFVVRYKSLATEIPSLLQLIKGESKD